MNRDVEYPMKNVNDDMLRRKRYLSLILHPIQFCLVGPLFIQLPAELGAVGVRAGIPAPGRDRDIPP